MEINHALKMDLLKYFTYERRRIIASFVKTPFPEATEYIKKISLLFEKFKPTIYNLLISTTKTHEKAVRYMTPLGWRFMNYQINVSYFLNYILSDKVLSLHISRLNKCYESFQKCRNLYLSFKITNFELLAAPAYYRYLRLVFIRYNANLQCVKKDPDGKNIIIIIEAEK